jgi:ABC-type spermidine/putrescine transport system permease subunit II
MLGKSLQDARGQFVGFANYLTYFKTPALFYSIHHSFYVAILSTLITVPLAFLYAYALTRSRMPARGLFKTIAFIPILVPSLLPGIALVYLFGNQGMIRWLMFGHSIYGPIGIVMAEVFFTFPHAFLIIATALALADARLYEAAVALRASRPRIFFTVTLPGARYGLISATFVVFTMVITDFGAPKVIGGQYNVLATDVYKQVIGQSNFEMGAVVSVVLLIPAAFAFAADCVARRRQVALMSARAVPYEPRPQRLFDGTMFAYCCLVAVFLVGMMAVSQFAALVRFYPYNLSLTLFHYDFERRGHRRVGGLRELDPHVGLRRAGRHRDRLRGSLPGREGAWHAERPRALPVPGHDADGGAGARPRPRLHLLLQRPRQPAQPPLPDDGDPGRQHDRALLHGRPPDRRHRLPADGPRVRGRLGVTQAALLPDVLASDGPGVPPGHPRRRHLTSSSTP